MDLTDRFREIMAFWGLTYKRTRPDVPLHGSPERAAYRTVVEDNTSSTLYVLEKIPKGSYNSKLRICKALAFLRERGMGAVQPYLSDEHGDYIMEHRGAHWQIVPHVPGVPLERPAYVFHGWRGKVCAQFLAELRRRGADMPFFTPQCPFSLKDYFIDVTEKIKLHHPEVFARFAPVVQFVEGHFLDIHDRLPLAFCHGDYHPLNIIWAEKGMHTVIDWEFAGYKSDIYDVANMLGCIGVEEPRSLEGKFAKAFLAIVRHEGLLSRRSCNAIVEYMVALRFAWLAEWLRKEDHEMIHLELDYMKLLTGNREAIRRAWDMSP
jgi:homoserine kinase type II